MFLKTSCGGWSSWCCLEVCGVVVGTMMVMGKRKKNKKVREREREGKLMRIMMMMITETKKERKQGGKFIQGFLCLAFSSHSLSLFPLWHQERDMMMMIHEPKAHFIRSVKEKVISNPRVIRVLPTIIFQFTVSKHLFIIKYHQPFIICVNFEAFLHKSVHILWVMNGKICILGYKLKQHDSWIALNYNLSGTLINVAFLLRKIIFFHLSFSLILKVYPRLMKNSNIYLSLNHS